MEYINQKKLCSFIKAGGRNIVNIFEDKLQYCNGYILVKLSYNHHEIISKLFKVEAIDGYRSFKSKETVDLSDVLSADSEVEVVETKFIKEMGINYLGRVFKVNEKYCIYNQKYIDIFKNVTFRANPNEEVPTLRVYYNENLVGLILPIRDRDGCTSEILGTLDFEDK